MHDRMAREPRFIETQKELFVMTSGLLSRSCKTKTIATLLAFTLISFAAGLKSSQAQDVPQVTIIQSSTDGLLEDLEMIVKDIAKRPKEWKVKVKPNIDIFLDGIDGTEPIRIDMLLKAKGEEYKTFLPMGNERDFLKNIKAVGINSKKRGRDLYILSGLIDGWLRFIEDKKKPKYNYAVMVKEKEDVPKGMPDPRKAIQKYIDGKYDIAAVITNNAKGLESRKESFATVIKNLLASLKKKTKESEAEFALRSLASEQQLREVERFFVESKFVESVWTTDNKTKKGTGYLTLEALPDTDLEKSIQLVNQVPSVFAAIPETKNNVATFRSNFPFDEFRKKQFIDLYNAFLPVSNAQIKKLEELNADQIAASIKANEILVDMFTEGTQLPAVDTFFEMIKNESGTHTWTAGVRTLDGTKVAELIRQIPRIDLNTKLTEDIEEFEGVKFHKIEFTNDGPLSFVSLLGKKPTFIIGTSKDVVWLAAGENGLETLKAQIQLTQVNKEAVAVKDEEAKGSATPFIKLSSNLQAWMIAYDIELKKQKIGNVEHRKEVLDALSEGDGRFTMKLWREKDTVKGSTEVDEGIFRVLGRMIAKMADENL